MRIANGGIASAAATNGIVSSTADQLSALNANRTRMTGHVMKPCLHCGKVMKVIRSNACKGLGKFCNRSCYLQYRRGNDESTLRRFYSRVLKGDGANDCWLWVGAKCNHGYGRIYYNRRLWTTHRLSYSLHIASIPKGMHVLHHCDNPSCVNPRHLFLGTQQDNMHDMVNKGRKAIGERNGVAKLTDDDVNYIRATYKPYNGSRSLLANLYGVHIGHISLIVRGKSWIHLLPKEDKNGAVANP